MILIGNFGTVPDEFDVFIAIPMLHHFPEIFDLLLSTEKECIDGNLQVVKNVYMFIWWPLLLAYLLAHLLKYYLNVFATANL